MNMGFRLVANLYSREMDVTGNSKSNDLQIACVYLEHETNGVTVRIADYKTLKEICI